MAFRSPLPSRERSSPPAGRGAGGEGDSDLSPSGSHGQGPANVSPASGGENRSADAEAGVPTLLQSKGAMSGHLNANCEIIAAAAITLNTRKPTGML